MRLFVLLAFAVTAHSAFAVDLDCAVTLVETARALHNPRLPARKRLDAAARFRDRALRRLDRGGVVWTPTSERLETEPMLIPGFTVAPVRNGTALNEFAADIHEDYQAYFDFDLGHLATFLAAAAFRGSPQVASILGSKESILHLQPGAYERHELDHLEIDDRRICGIPSIFHGALTVQRSDDPLRVQAYPHLSFDELYAYARDVVNAVRPENGEPHWRQIIVLSRLLRRMSERIGAASRAALLAMDDGEDEGWFEWEALRNRPEWRIPTFRFRNVPGLPQLHFADYSEPLMMKASRFPVVQVPKLTTELLTRTIADRRALGIAKRALGRVAPEIFATHALLTTPQLTLSAHPSAAGGMQVHVDVLDGDSWKRFTAPVAESTAYVTAVLGNGTDRPRHRLTNYDAVFRVARRRFERLADACDVLAARSARIVAAARAREFTEATDVALSFEGFLDTVDDQL